MVQKCLLLSRLDRTFRLFSVFTLSPERSAMVDTLTSIFLEIYVVFVFYPVLLYTLIANHIFVSDSSYTGILIPIYDCIM